MQVVLLVIHMMIAAALVGVVLLQKSEGGALGIGGGGGGGFLTGRGQANLLTRTTAFLAAGFFATSLALTLIAQHTGEKGSVFDSKAPAAVQQQAPAATDPAKTPDAKAPEGKPVEGRGGILDKLDPRPQPLGR